MIGRPGSTILMADSCSGGIGVLKYVSAWAGRYNVEYLADYEYNPLGIKSQHEIGRIVSSWFKCLVNKNDVCLFVIACNTASIASEPIKQKLITDFGVPIVNMIDAIEACVNNNETLIRGKNVAIIATKYTIESEVYQKIVSRYRPNSVIGIVATKCEGEVAMGRFKTPEGKRVINDELSEFSNRQIDTAILACTCFKSIEDQIIERLGSKVICIDPASESSNNSIDIMCKTNMKRVIKVNYLELTR